jgi:hypothetical protein
MTLRPTLMLAACVIATGCASAAKLPPAGAMAYGVYHFRQQVADARPAMTLEGDVVLAPDTVIVSTTMAPCSYNTRARDARSINYQCGSLSISFDRSDPLRKNAFAVRTTQIVTVKVCAMMAMTNGVDRCTRYEDRRESREVMKYGKLELQVQ